MLAHFGGMSTRWEATSRSKSDLSVLLEITFKTNRIDCMSYSDKDYDSKINCICVGASLISVRRKQENQGSNVSTQNLYLHPTPRHLASDYKIKMFYFFIFWWIFMYSIIVILFVFLFWFTLNFTLNPNQLINSLSQTLTVEVD